MLIYDIGLLLQNIHKAFEAGADPKIRLKLDIDLRLVLMDS